MRYYVHNISDGNVAFDIFNPFKGTAHSILIPRGQMTDMIPYAGSLESCKNIPGLKRLSDTNQIKIIIKD